MSTEPLAEAPLEQLADLVVDRLLERLGPLLADETPRPAATLVDAHELARTLSLSRTYVYEHAAELGGVRMGDGARPRWRFDPEKARAAYESGGSACSANRESHPVPTGNPSRRRRSPAQSGVTLLPIRGVPGKGGRP